MKKGIKLLPILLAVMFITGSVAFAEEGDAAAPVDLGGVERNYEPAWFELGNGLQIALPADWVAVPVAEEYAADGIFYLGKNAADTVHFGMALLPADATDIAALADQMTAAYPGLYHATANGTDLLLFDEPGGAYSTLTIAVEPVGFYVLTFEPALADEDLRTTALGIATSIGPTEDAEEAPAETEGAQ